MPRPLRIEYPDAYYHVINRGRSRQDIFCDKKDYELFLGILAEAHQRFRVQILCYCLMSNHYHLLVKTPEGNLGRVMRHINGIYTQRYNRKHKTDGTLFRGRYKAILIEEDGYQLQLSRYIHLNPLEAGMVEKLEDYYWSSYPYYMGQSGVPIWLFPQEVLSHFQGNDNVYHAYRNYVLQGVDEELRNFYGKENIMPYLGSDSFRDWVYQQRLTDETEISRETRKLFHPDIDSMIGIVSKQFEVSQQSIVASKRGRVEKNIPRWVAMYLCQQICSATLKEIANAFRLNSVGSISTNIRKLKKLFEEDKKLLQLTNKIIIEYGT